MNGLALAVRQVRYQNRSFWRNPTLAFFTFVLPLIFLVILNALLGNDEADLTGGRGQLSDFYVPSMAALSIINACYTSIVMTVTIARDDGLLKRVRGTPLPGWAYVFGRVVHTTLIGLLLVAIVVAFGAVFYDVDVPTETMPAFILTCAVGAAAFSALGLALSSFTPNAEAAPAVANATILPVLFISDVFVRLDDPPKWLDILGDIFPVKHLSEACQAAFNPFATGSGFEWLDLAVVAAWGLVGAVLAVRYFTWYPRE
ncbi:MAG TPA: ABC transporter permease [Dehalococcoidia bacterium]|jgi:ABC-2 type transport system permease protein|nr:ABC transporter permease [Dehalococcoidia bacterium]